MQLRITSRKKLTSLLCALGLISIVAIYPRQTVNFFYSTAVQITDYIHFYGYRPVKSFAIRIPASYTIHGIDVSRWQERIDWQRVAKMRDNGIRLQFAFIKATEGEKLVDPYFSRNWQLSRENGLLRGAYHYFSPSVAAPVQARLFLQTVDFSQGDFPAVLDVEERGKIIGKRITQTSKSVAKNGRKKVREKSRLFTQEPFFITPIWRAISMNIRGGWLTIINVVRTMTAWPGASGSIPTVDR
ncbi:1,4-beta-N-acetylmuramidase [Escherichia coli]|nr:1,4-beta-N-acetylmuramidase [Escherichia coli]